MRLLIKQRVFSWSDTYDIYDENGAEKYFVKADIFTFGHQIHVYDWQDREIGFISQKLFSLMPKFFIEIGGYEVGMVSKKFTLFHPEYTIDYRGWQCEGDFFGWEYEIFEGDNCIAYITKELFHWGDTYVIDILRPEDEIDVLMLCIAIDAANCSNGND